MTPRLLVASCALLLPAAAFAQVTVSATATCPGSVNATISGLTPLGAYAVFTSAAPGAFALPPGPCAGTTTGLDAAGFAVRATGLATAAGQATVSSPLPVAACGLKFQVLDVVSCTLGSVGTIPAVLTSTTIEDIQLGVHLPGTAVGVQGVVTAASGIGLWVQTSGAPSQTWGGIFVYLGTGWELTWGAVSPGDLVEVSGDYVEFNDKSEIEALLSPNRMVRVIGAEAVPAPAVVSLSELNTTPEPWEGVLVRIQNVTVSNPDIGFGEWEVHNGVYPMVIDDGMYWVDPLSNPIGTVYSFIQGPFDYTFGAFKIQPRGAIDLG